MAEPAQLDCLRSHTAEVVWSNVNVPPDRVINRGMGIRFIDNEEEKRKTLSKAIAATVRSSAET